MLLDWMPSIMSGLSSIAGLSSDKRQEKMHQAQLRQSQGQFDAQMDQSVQRRMADAKKAGIHPLFAMGASVGASPTISSGGSPQAGRGAQAGLAALANQLGVVQSNKASAARDEAEAQLANAQAARIRQDMYSQGRDKQTVPNDAPQVGLSLTPTGGTHPAAVYETDIGPRQDPAGYRAAVQPAMTKITLPGGRQISVPDPQTFEEPWSPATLAAIGQTILGATDQEIWAVVKKLGSHFSKNFRVLGLTDQQIFDKLKRAANSAGRYLKGGKRHYGSNW